VLENSLGLRVAYFFSGPRSIPSTMEVSEIAGWVDEGMLIDGRK
jgi:hypothetical protein